MARAPLPLRKREVSRPRRDLLAGGARLRATAVSREFADHETDEIDQVPRRAQYTSRW
jgi:hypothetical protein